MTRVLLYTNNAFSGKKWAMFENVLSVIVSFLYINNLDASRLGKGNLAMRSSGSG